MIHRLPLVMDLWQRLPKMLTRFFQKLDTSAIQATEWKVSQLWSAIQQVAGHPLNFLNAFVKIFIVSIYIQIDSFDNESEYKH